MKNPKDNIDWIAYRYLYDRNTGKIKIAFYPINNNDDNEWIVLPLPEGEEIIPFPISYADKSRVINTVEKKHEQFLCRFLNVGLKTLRTQEKKYGATLSTRLKQYCFSSKENAQKFITEYVEPAYIKELLGVRKNAFHS